MPQRTAMIESLPMAFEVVTEMQADGLAWGEGYRAPDRRAHPDIKPESGGGQLQYFWSQTFWSHL